MSDLPTITGTLESLIAQEVEEEAARLEKLTGDEAELRRMDRRVANLHRCLREQRRLHDFAMVMWYFTLKQTNRELMDVILEQQAQIRKLEQPTGRVRRLRGSQEDLV